MTIRVICGPHVDEDQVYDEVARAWADKEVDEIVIHKHPGWRGREERERIVELAMLEPLGVC